MKRKSVEKRESDSESDGSMELDYQSEGLETPDEEYAEDSDREGMDPDQEILSAQDEDSVGSAVSGEYADGTNEQLEAPVDDTMSIESADDESDRDSVSLNSLDTVELETATRKKKEEQEALRNREFAQLYVPAGGIFDHVLVQGLPIDEEEYKLQQKAFFNGDTAAERTTTRNTPASVIEALDRELRFSKPPVTVDILVARYNVIKLVIKRRIDHLRAHGHSTPGIRYDHSTYDDAAEGTRIVRSSHSDRLLRDIQFLDPPVTVKEMAILHKMSVNALHAKIYALRNKGIMTRGIVASTTGRGRPRKVDSGATYETAASTENANASFTDYSGYTYRSQVSTVDKNSRVLKYFTQEEDTKLANAILRNVERGVRVDWNGMDTLLERSRGAAKQRWLKTLERRVGAEVRLCLSNRLAGLYRDLYKPLQSGSGSGSSDSASEGGADDSGGADSNASDDETSSSSCMDLGASMLKVISTRLEVGAVLRAMVDAVQTHSDTFPHATITVHPHHSAHKTPSTHCAPVHTLHTPASDHTTAPTTPTNTSSSALPSRRTGSQHTARTARATLATERTSRNIVPTTAAREGYAVHNPSRRAFTEADDVLIISTVLEHRQAGVGRFWAALDAQLQRHVMAAKGRWQRVLEPIVNERIADSKGSTSSGASDSLYAQYSALSGESSTGTGTGSVDGKESAVREVVDSIVRVLDTPAPTPTTTNTTGNRIVAESPFSAAEDAIILSRAQEWESSGTSAWSALDTELNRPPFSALVRYKTALAKAPEVPLTVTPAHTLVPPPFVSSNADTRSSDTRHPREYEYRPSSYTRLELLLMYNAHWTRTMNTTPLVLEQGSDVVVNTVVQHLLAVVVATHRASTNAPAKRGIGRPRIHHRTDISTATTNATTNPATTNSATANNTITPKATHPAENTNHRLRRFTAEEDAYVEKTIREAKESGISVSWSALDRALGRSTGAVRQRWKKVLNNEY